MCVSGDTLLATFLFNDVNIYISIGATAFCTILHIDSYVLHSLLMSKESCIVSLCVSSHIFQSSMSLKLQWHS